MFSSLRQVVSVARSYGVHRMPHAMLTLFQTFVFPYAMYASQVWSTAFLRVKDVFRCPLQSRLLGFVRYFLGVTRSVPNQCLISEVCMKPLQFYWLRSCLNFLSGCHRASSALLLSALHSDVALSRSCKSCWMSQVNAALQALNGSVGAAPVGRDNIRLCLQAWKQSYDANWQTLGEDPCLPGTENRKCVTYKAWFKQSNDTSFKRLPSYLRAGLQLPSVAVRSMAQFRLGCHPLRVERGRFTRLPYEQRVCLRCTNGSVDNEHHMLFECTSFNHLRHSQRFCHLFKVLVVYALLWLKVIMSMLPVLFTTVSLVLEAWMLEPCPSRAALFVAEGLTQCNN